MKHQPFNAHLLKLMCIFGLLFTHLTLFSKDTALQITSGYSIDLSGQRTINEAPSQSFEPMPENFVSLGFVNHPIWIKLNFTDTKAATPYKFLVLNPARHDQVQLFQVSRNNNYHTKIESLSSIEKIAFFGESQKNIFLLGNISPEADYYLEIQPYGPMNIHLSLKDSEELETDFYKKLFLLGGAIFCLFIFTLLVCFLYHTNREIIYIHFLFHTIATVMVFISTLGFGINFLTEKFSMALNRQMGLFMILNISSSLLLFGNILKLMPTPALLSKYLNYFPAVNLLFILWLIVTDMQDAWFWSSMYGVCFCVIYGISFIKFFDKKMPAQWVLAIFSTTIYFVLLLVLLSLLGILPLSNQTVQMNFLRICFLPIIFGLIFWFYEIVKRNRMIEIEIEKSANSKNLELEVQRRRTYEGFMGMLVHEIKTPLSIIQIASISLGRRFTSSSNEAQRISNIDKSVNDINDILYKCVQVSDIENNSVFVDKSQIEVDDLINELSLQFKSEQIKWDNQPNLQVFTDYVLLRTILNNLLSNALKYSKKDTSILFFCHGFSGDDRHLVRFSLTNEMGPAGMPDSNKVFERYYRGSNTSSLPGTGLGLWLSQSIAHTIGSHIEIEIIENRISFSIEVAAAV